MSTDTDTATDTDRTYVLSVDEFAATVRKIEQLQGRAVKRGFTGSITVTGEREVRDNNGFYPDLPDSAQVVVVRTSIVGTSPSYEGWSFLASLTQLATKDGGAWTVNTPPGVQANIDRSTLRDGACDHCNTVRPTRRKLYLVRHEATGEVKQVGSTCIKDFLGWSTMPVWIDPEAASSCIVSGNRGESRFESRWVFMLALACAATTGGFVARSSYSDSPATADLMSNYLFSRGKDAADLRAGVEVHFAQADADVDHMLDVVSGALEDQTSDFAQNMRAVVSAIDLGARQFGLAAAALSVFSKATTEAVAVEPAVATPRVWVGDPDSKDKVTIAGVVTTALTLDGYMPGSTKLMLVVDDGLHVIKTFTTAAWSDDVDKGDKVTLVGTVKSHDEYRGVKQTVLTRCKLLDA